jgi:hypothetical protein
LKLRFVARPETDEQIASLMRYGNRGSIYRPDEAFVNSDNPRIRAMVDPLLELVARTEAEREHFDALGASDKVVYGPPGKDDYLPASPSGGSASPFSKA